MPAESLTQVVDENDKPIDGLARREIQQQGLWHRVVGVWLCDEETGDILLQERLSGRGLDDEKLDSSASGHVDPGEGYESTAIRETQEELGIDLDEKDLEEIAYFRSQARQGEKILNRFTKVFRVKIAREVLKAVILKEDELAATKILTHAEFDDLVRHRSDETVPGVVIAHHISQGEPVPETVARENRVVVLSS